MRDVHYEVKCWNPLIKSTTSGRGSWDKGGNVASVGHLYSMVAQVTQDTIPA